MASNFLDETIVFGDSEEDEEYVGASSDEYDTHEDEDEGTPPQKEVLERLAKPGDGVGTLTLKMNAICALVAISDDDDSLFGVPEGVDADALRDLVSAATPMCTPFEFIAW
jgi:hypothetical protein